MLRWPPAYATADFALPAWRTTITICAVLLGLVAVVFGQVHEYQFTLWDDPTYVSRNPLVLKGLTLDGLVWAFTEFWASNWHPVAWLSHMLDAELWGNWAGGHHLSGVVIHAAATLALWVFLQRVTGAAWRSALVAALFAIHPLHVESVAWVSERKDVLAGLLWMLTLLAYRRYVLQPGWGRYGLVTLSFAVGLMAKPMLVTLPLVLLLLDVWPFGRLEVRAALSPRRLACSPVVLEKLPWLLLSAVSSLVTVQAQQAAIVPAEVLSGAERIGIILIAYATYIWQMVWPAALSFFYEPPANLLQSAVLAVPTMLGLLALAAWGIRSGRHVVAVGVAWYLVTLIPVVGVVKVGPQAYADRYTYLPLVGIFIALAWLPSGRWVVAGSQRCRMLAALSVLLVAVLSVLSWRQTAHWRDSESLFAHAVELNPKNAVALVQYGEALIEKGDRENGARAVHQAMALSSGLMVRFNGLVALGNVAFAARRYDEAYRYYAAAHDLGTSSALPDYNLGTVLLTLGRAGEARSHLQRALKRHPRYAEAYANLGVAEERLGNAPAAIAAYRAALQLDAGNRGAQENLRRLQLRLGRGFAQ